MMPTESQGGIHFINGADEVREGETARPSQLIRAVGHAWRCETNGPFDLVFAPDGIERFEDAWGRRVEVEGVPICHIDDIIASKTAADRVRDRESLPRLRSFREYGCGSTADCSTRRAPLRPRRL